MADSLMRISWWDTERAQRTLNQWKRDLIGGLPYDFVFSPGEESALYFSQRLVKVNPELSKVMDAPLLPYQWTDKTVEHLPLLNAYLCRAVTAHECGHILFTASPSRSLSRHAMSFWNSLEDERMERLVTYRFPAYGPELDALNAYIWAHQNPKPDLPDYIKMFNAVLCYRFEQHFHCARSRLLDLLDTPKLQALWQSQVEPLVQQAWTTMFSTDVEGIATALVNLLIDEEITPPPTPMIIIVHGTVPPELRASEELRDLQQRNISAYNEQHSPQESEEQTPDSTSEEQDSGACSEPTSSDSSDAPQEQETTVFVVDAEEYEKGNIVHLPAEDHLFKDFVNTSHSTDPSKSAAKSMLEVPYIGIIREVQGLAKSIARVLQLPVVDVSPIASKRHGTVSLREVRLSKGQTPLLDKNIPDEAPLEQAALCIMIDGTGSMGNTTSVASKALSKDFYNPEGRMFHVRRAAMALYLVCRDLGIPLSIGECCGDVGSSRGTPVRWLSTFDDSHSVHTPARIAGLYGYGGAERYDAGLEAAYKALATRRERHKIFIYILDGNITEGDTEALRRQTQQMERTGVSALGLLLGDSDGIDNLKLIFQRGLLEVASPQDLTRVLGYQMKRLRTL